MTSPQQHVAALRSDAQAKLQRGRARLIELGEAPARIEVAMRYAEQMLEEQIRCTERRLGLVAAVVVH